MGSSTRVYVLGAGCSVCGGYPLASGVRKALGCLAKTKLQNASAAQIFRCVQRTCELMDEHQAQTTDQLARILGDERRIEIEESKKAMSALFFSLEDEGVKMALPSYAALFEEIFEQGDSPELESRIKTTNCRVLTYNYDRMFERAFIEWIRPQLRDHTNLESNALQWLNCGLPYESKIEFDPNGFALIKLHGGIGQFNRDHDFGLNHVYPFDFDRPLPPIADNPYFEIPDQKSNLQTIFYPTDKRRPSDRRAENGRSTLSRLAYEHAVWNAAEDVCRTASEIQIIGYSMSPIDWWSFKALIRAAENCRKIVIRNRAQVVKELTDKMQRLRTELGAPWEVEGREEDFFGRPASSEGDISK